MIHEADETLEEELERRGGYASLEQRKMETPRRVFEIDEVGFHSQSVFVPKRRQGSHSLIKPLQIVD